MTKHEKPQQYSRDYYNERHYTDILSLKKPIGRITFPKLTKHTSLAKNYPFMYQKHCPILVQIFVDNSCLQRMYEQTFKGNREDPALHQPVNHFVL